MKVEFLEKRIAVKINDEEVVVPVENKTQDIVLSDEEFESLALAMMNFGLKK